MNNIIYQSTISPGADAPDGETSHTISLTQEANGYAVWETSYYQSARAPLQWHHLRHEAIEAAVGLVMARRQGAIPSIDPDSQLGHGDNACHQEEGA